MQKQAARLIPKTFKTRNRLATTHWTRAAAEACSLKRLSSPKNGPAVQRTFATKNLHKKSPPENSQPATRENGARKRNGNIVRYSGPVAWSGTPSAKHTAIRSVQSQALTKYYKSKITTKSSQNPQHPLTYILIAPLLCCSAADAEKHSMLLKNLARICAIANELLSP